MGPGCSANVRAGQEARERTPTGRRDVGAGRPIATAQVGEGFYLHHSGNGGAGGSGVGTPTISAASMSRTVTTALPQLLQSRRKGEPSEIRYAAISSESWERMASTPSTRMTKNTAMATIAPSLINVP